MKKLIVATAVASITLASSAFAANGAGVVSSDALRSTKISYTLSGKKKQKVIFCLSKVPGEAKSVSGGMLFTPFSNTLIQLRAKKVKGTKLTTYTQLNSAGKKACAKIPAQPTPTPTSAPTQVPTGNFDSSGNVTARGKAAFGIPSTLSGNIALGKITVQSYCTCHEERIGYTFSNIRVNIARDPMFFDETAIPDSVLANITAYLNRFNF